MEWIHVLTKRQMSVRRCKTSQRVLRRVALRVLRKASARGDAARVEELLRALPWSARALHDVLKRVTEPAVSKGFERGAPRFYNEGGGAAEALLAAAKVGRVRTVLALLTAGVSPDCSSPRRTGRRGEFRGVRALHLAVASGHVTTTAALLAAGADIHASAEGQHPLHLAARNGHTACVHLLLDAGARAEIPCRRGWTPQHHAAARGYRECLEVLLERGAQVDALGRWADTPLLLAAGGFPDAQLLYGIRGRDSEEEEDYVGCVGLLLARGADVNATSMGGYPPLRAAVENGNADIARCLIEAGADANIEDRHGQTLLHLLAQSGDSAGSCAEVLVNTGGLNVDAKSRCGMTPLHVAAQRRDVNTVRVLLRLHADVSCVDVLGHTPLHMAAMSGHANVVQELVSAGSEVGARGENEETPLHHACSPGAILALVRGGGCVNARAADGRTPMHFAAALASSSLSRLCMEQLYLLGADMEAMDEHGWTPLHCAVVASRLHSTRWLAAQGACLGAPAKDGATPLHVAAAWGDAPMVKALLALKAPIDAEDLHGRTALHAAAEGTSEDTVRALLEGGAARGAEDVMRRTPAQLATDPRIWRLLEFWALAA